MPYGWGGLPSSLPAEWMVYSEMFNEFSREIANSINELTRYTHQLAAWHEIVSRLSDREKMNVAHEFVNPLGTVAINLSYVIRSRFIFATAHLCHQANQVKQGKSWRDDLPLDDEIYFEQADLYGAAWGRYPKLKVSLEKIGSKSYQAATANFRNTYNHRFSPRIVIGQTQIITRQVDIKTRKVSYGIGATNPLTLDVVVTLLGRQCDHCYKSFINFQKLVKEHELAIVATL